MSLGERRITSSKDVQNPDLLPGEGKVIIAMKGLPYTVKSGVALRIGQWMRCPVLSIDDFLDSVSLEKGSPTSKEEAERFRLLASYALYKMAHRYLALCNCVVIKSRLYSLLELDLLMCLVEASSCANLIIVECRIMNEFWFRGSLEYMVKRGMNKEFDSQVKTFSRSRGRIMKGLEEHSLSHVVGHLEWYKAKSWKDVENAKDDWIDDQAWDDHLLCFINDNVLCPRFVSRLVVDPYDDLDFLKGPCPLTLQPDFLHVISHLLDRRFKYRQACWTINRNLDESKRPNRYLVTKFNKLRKSLVKEELRSSIYKQRSNKLCTTNGDPCVFKYHEKLHFKDSGHCMMCQKRVEPGTQAYTCHFCILTLHELCAKTLDLNFLEHMDEYSESLLNFKENIACESCDEKGRAFSPHCASCLFTTHVKLRFLPTIIKHEGHEHFLSIQIQFEPGGRFRPEYGCHECKFHHRMELFFKPREVRHVHGGYEHVMKLTYAHRHDDDVMEPEDDYWCDVCYVVMDPQRWFYYCQDCSYYITHFDCPGQKSIREAIRHRKLAI
ncbi:hypothetical protein V2J09_005342 [Rumex salicifolius]